MSGSCRHLVQAAQEDVKDYMQQRRLADKAAHLKQQTSEEAATDAEATAVAQAAAAKAARAAAEKQVGYLQAYLPTDPWAVSTSMQQFNAVQYSITTAIPLCSSL